MTHHSHMISLIAAVLIVGSTAALAQGSSSASSVSKAGLPGTNAPQIASCDTGKSKGPLGY